jgi:hypothetical protein
MRRIWCAGCGQEIEIPPGIASNETFACPNCAGLTLRAIERDGEWTVREVKTASCPVGDEPVVLPDDVQPGDIVECHGRRHRVSYEFGAYALVPADGG